MKRFVTALLGFVFLLSVSGLAAKPEFRVMASKGDVEYKKTGAGWSKLKTGTKIYSDYKIKADGKCYLGLIHTSGKTVEIKQSGEWSVNQLKGMLSTKKTSVAGKLAGYVMDKLGEGDEGEYNYREGMETTGAVERSLSLGASSGSAAFVELRSPRKVNFTSGSASFVWLEVNNEKNYIFTITDRFDRIVHTKEVSGNSYSVDADELKLEKDDYYFWSVASKSDRSVKSPDCAFSFLSSTKVEEINQEFSELQAELGDENNAVNQLMYGNFYEQNYLMTEAMKHYKKAVELEPSVPEYQTIYSQFLKRANF